MKVRRFQRASAQIKSKGKWKVRPLAKVAHKEGAIYSYYAYEISKKYEELLKNNCLGNVVVGYRKHSSNILVALSAFSEIKSRGPCTAMAFDIKGFFDNIDHVILKSSWCKVLRETRLPKDHYAVFKALTQASSVDEKDLKRALNLLRNDDHVDSKYIRNRLCTIAEFRKLRHLYKRSREKSTGKIMTKGIPQGTPLSSVAANISMLDFDIAMNTVALETGASYRRYSDDILIICNTSHADEISAELEESLNRNAAGLLLSSDKSERVSFEIRQGKLVSSEKSSKPLQYLGFTFDGNRTLLRSGTLSRSYRRMANGVRYALRCSKLVEIKKLHGRPGLHRKKLYAKYTHLGRHLGKGNFYTEYARRAVNDLSPVGGDAIKSQIARHRAILESMITRGRQRIETSSRRFKKRKQIPTISISSDRPRVKIIIEK